MTHNPTAHPTDEATPSDFVAVMQQVADVEGWMSLDQAGTLHDAAARCVTRAITRALLAATSVDRSADGGLVAPTWRDALTRRD